MFYFIVNLTSKSGRSAKIWDKIEKYLQKNNVDYMFWIPERIGHATQLATFICDNFLGKINLVVVGGDGTVNEVINGITDFDRVSFAVIPTGSGNDFIRGLNLKGNPIKHLERIVNSKSRKAIDVGIVEWTDRSGTEGKRYFAISSGVGMDAIVCKKAYSSKLKKILNAVKLGKLTYLMITVETLFSMKTVDSVFTYFKEDSKESTDSNLETKNYPKLIFAAVMNFRAEGGGVPMAPNADATDGLLSVCCAYGIPKWKTFFILPVLVMAKHEKLKGIDIIDTDKLEINLDMPEVLHADGEYLGDVTRAKFSLLKSRLNMIE